MAAERLRLALDMYEFGEAMVRARLRREKRGASDLEIDVLVQAWLTDVPPPSLGGFERVVKRPE